ncbi:MAG: hypothetical protein QXK57_06675 [Conexivisphaerales archaeon]
MLTLSQDQVEWIIRKNEVGRLTKREIAVSQGILKGRVLQLYREYRMGDNHEFSLPFKQAYSVM